MRHFLTREAAESIEKWQTFFEAILLSILTCLLVFGHAEFSRTSLACLSNPCIYGICIDEVNNTFLCYCIDGYTGLLCQTNWDECWSNPCKNGGICVDGIAHYNCSCPQGYQGQNCEQNINECDSNPCRNNATCQDDSNGYTCICPSGYLGEFCETDISVCNDTSEIRCLNGGLCIEGPGFTYNCACPLGWTGRFCEESIDECSSSPCYNGGICLDLQANYTCACPFGYTGRNCEIELEMCGDTSPCQNGAVCLVEDWLRVCYCVPDFHGDRCQFRYNECLLGPGCQNGGTCIDGVDGYTCSCPAKWSGIFCECRVINEEELDCDSLFIDPIKATETPIHKEIQKVPTWITSKVPKIIPKIPFPTTKTITTKEVVHKFFPSYSTQCFPIWPHYTSKSPKTTTKFFYSKTITSKDQLTEKVETAATTVSSAITKPMTLAFTSEITAITTTTTQTTPTTTTTTTQTTPTTTTTTTQTTPTTTTTTTQTTPTTTTTTTQTTPATTTTTTQTTPTTTTTTTQTTPTTTTTTTQTIPSTITPMIKTTTEAPTTTTHTETTTYLTTTTTEMVPLITTTETSMTTIIELTPVITTTTMEPHTAEATTIKTIPQITAITEHPTDTTTLMSLRTTTNFTSEIPSTIFISKKITTDNTTLFLTNEIKNTSLKFTTQFTSPKITPISLSTQKSLFDTDFDLNSVTSSTEKPKNCTIIFCQNGGTCISVPRGLKCLCKPNWEGLFCDSKVNLKVAGFSGKSYLSHILNNTHNVRIDITVKTVMPMGIILYSHLAPNIFMTLYLENGYLKFKFSCGVQTMILSEVQFQVNNGFDLVATITLDFIPPTRSPFHCTAAVRINNTLAMSGEQLAKGPQTDFGFAWIYLGGVPIRYINPVEVPIQEGFIGCMQNLMINKKAKGIFKDCFESNGIVECKSLACVSNPCRSGSTCVEHNNTWTCLCPSGFLGRYCELSVCKNNPCQFGGTCSSFPGSGFICLCPAGKQGLFCEKDAEVGYPLFASSVGGLSSFAAYKLPTEIYQDMFLKFKFLPHDLDQISLMVFIGQEGYHGATSDHLAVAFIKGYVVLTWNLGSGPRRIFTPLPVPNIGNTFHTVQIGKIGQRFWLVVDNQRNVTGRSPGKLTQLNTKSVLYLGGHESRNFSLLPHDLPLHTGFSGCMFDFELRTGQMLIKVEKSLPTYSRGVGTCGSALCNEFSCKNGGGCIHHGATFTCLCSDGWFGPTCSMKYNPCDSSRHNCSEGSTCVPLHQGFSCDCPVGKSGKYCEKSEEFSDVRFTGIRSYVGISIDLLNHYQSCIDLEIRPQSHHGLILYAGRLESNSFWALTLQDGFLELRVSSGLFTKTKEVIVIKSRRLLMLNKWQRIRAGKYGKRLFLWVEGTLSTGVSLTSEIQLYSGNIIYLGGIPDLSKLPVGMIGKTITSFNGCMRKIKSQWKSIPLIKSNIIEGRNVEDCDGTVCGGDVCENNGTCHIDASNKPICTCLKHYMGKRCEYRLSCKHMSCQNGGRCSNETRSTPVCHCPNGWGGPFCESALSVNEPQFKGNSYLLVERLSSRAIKRRDTRNKVDVNFIAINFTTAEPNGMLLWSSSNYEEFIGVGILNEKLKLAWAWKGKNITTVSFNEHVTDGGWHELVISFNLPNISILLDHHLVYNSTMDHPNFPLSTDGRFFLGGFPENKQVAIETYGHFLSGFNGCLQKLAWSLGSAIINFSKFQGENIRPCNPFE